MSRLDDVRDRAGEFAPGDARFEEFVVVDVAGIDALGGVIEVLCVDQHRNALGRMDVRHVGSRQTAR